MEEKILTKEEIVEDFKDNLVSNDEIEGNDDSSSYGEDEERKLVTDKQDPDVASLYGRYTRNKLILQPDYQRKFVMKQAVASRLIESMLLGIPLPVVYFAEEEDGSYTGVACDLDLIDNADAKDECINALVNSIQDYASDYYKEFSL